MQNYSDDILSAMEKKDFLEKFAHDPSWCHYLSVGHHKKGQNVKHVYFVTINPSEQKVQFKQFFNLVQKFVNKTTVLSAVYCFEQRSDIDGVVGKGFHVHMLLHVNPNQFGRNTENTFRHVVGGNAPIKSVINIIRVSKRPFLDDKIFYMKGSKWGLDKDKKVEGDKLFREREKICDLYTKNKSYFNI